MFERYTEHARQVVVLAQDEARALKHNYIGTEHILLGLLREEEGLARRVLESLDITVEEARAQVARIVGQGDEMTTGQIPFTPRAKKVLELTQREALSLGHNYIGTEHILLGLVRENEGVGARILLDFDADAEKIRDETLRMLPGSERRKVQAPRAPAAPSDLDQERRTSMAAERTWLAWWRTALGATAGALAVGRFAPKLLDVAPWPYILLGCGYAALAVGLAIVGAQRQRQLEHALRTGAHAPLKFDTVVVFTVGGVALTLLTVVLVIAQG